jgi:hypothetical protein
LGGEAARTRRQYDHAATGEESVSVDFEKSAPQNSGSLHRPGTGTDLRKERILEIYLNVIEWGDGIYGINAAANRYFGKSAGELNPEEAGGTGCHDSQSAQIHAE